MTFTTEATAGASTERGPDDPLGPGKAIAATLRSTLGPNGLDKMVIDRSGSVVVTNTGATVLDGLEIDAPIGRVIRDAVQAHARHVGDGTTTTALLVGALLGAADGLADQGLHPTSIVDGYAGAASHARDALRELSVPVEPGDERLREVASTAVTGRWDAASARRFADITVDALRAVDCDPARLTVHAYPGGELADSKRVNGILVDVDGSSTTVGESGGGGRRALADPTIALIDGEVAVPAAEASGRVTVESPDDLAAVREHERASRSGLVRSVTDRDVDVLVCQKSIDHGAKTELARAGVLPVERTRRDEFDAIARAANATAVTAVADLDRDALGAVGSVRCRSVGGGAVIELSGLPGESHESLLLRGGTPHVAEETKRIVEDCLAVSRHAARGGGAVPGGGAAMMAVSRAVADRASGVDDRSALAVEAFADAVTVIPRTLARNAGADPIDALVALRNRHRDGETAAGVARSGAVRDMFDAGAVEPVAVPARCLETAVRTAGLVLRVDETLDAEAIEGHGDDGDGRGHPGDDRHGHGSDGEGESDGHAGGYPWALSH
ncbi:TCP-1/cpn60 chaperonin family protein [Halorubrum sp. Hd13]|uniref:TCP-1/cpn60 chaperonin family protein n=1 Tax=Halorubrum sp. Hd13 TaxID=1480728 RepID=UPI000B98687C|nr:TCP-1/cpn60 chaperonin family protein [Halorubrum sp. Hd13]OYR39783.1 chaperonin Cpn60 [Halorubrum sp. Hd13]